MKAILARDDVGFFGEGSRDDMARLCTCRDVLASDIWEDTTGMVFPERRHDAVGATQENEHRAILENLEHMDLGLIIAVSVNRQIGLESYEFI